MRKPAVKPRRKGTPWLTRFRPQVEALECRAQPGSVLGVGSSLPGAVALDPDSQTDLDRQLRDEATVLAEYRLTQDSDLALRIHDNGLLGSGVPDTAPFRPSGIAATPIQPSAPSSLSIQQQSQAVAGHARLTQAATSARPADRLGQGSMTAPPHGTVGTSNSNHGPDNSNGPSFQVAAVSMANLMVAAKGRAVSQALAVHSVTGLTTTTFRYRADSKLPPPPDVSVIYDSYVGNGVPDATGIFGDKATSIRGQADGSALITGFVTDQATMAHDAFAGIIDPTGATLTVAVMGDPTGATDVQGNAIDIGSDGAIYVVGTMSPAGSLTSPGQVPQGEFFYARFEPGLPQGAPPDWVLTIGSGTADEGNAARIVEDPNLGESLVMSGELQDPGTGFSDLMAIEVSNLSADPAQLQLAGGAFAFSDPRGNPDNSIGYGIALDPTTGNLMVAGALGLNAGADNPIDTTALTVGFAAGFQSMVASHYPYNAGIGQTTAGAFNSVDVDSSGTFYLAGTTRDYFINPANHEFNPRQDLLIAKATTDGATTIHYGYLTTWFEYNSDNTNSDWYATGNAVIPGGGGAQATTSTVKNPGGIALFRVDSSGLISLDGNSFIGPPGGSSDDESAGLSVFPDPSGSGNDYYEAGYTASTDFLTTPNSFEPNDPDATGTLQEGWVDVSKITPI